MKIPNVNHWPLHTCTHIHMHEYMIYTLPRNYYYKVVIIKHYTIILKMHMYQYRGIVQPASMGRTKGQN